MAIIDLVSLLIIAMLVNNVLFADGLGTPLVVSANRKNALAMGTLTTLLIIIINSILFFIDKYVITVYGLEYIELFICVMVVFGIYTVANLIIKKVFISLYGMITCNFRILAGNSAVLGGGFLLLEENLTYLEVLSVAIGTGSGLILTMLFFVATKRIIDASPFIPEAFRGTPIQLLSLSIIGLIFMALGDIVMALMGNINI